MFCSLRSCSYLYYLWHFFYDPNVATVVRSHFNNINAVCPHAPSLSLTSPCSFPQATAGPQSFWYPSLCECLFVCCSLVFLCFFHPGFYFSLVGGHYKNKIPQLRGPLEAIKCIFMLQAAVCFLCELFQLPFFLVPKICLFNMPNAKRDLLWRVLWPQKPNSTTARNSNPATCIHTCIFALSPPLHPCYSVASSFPFVKERRSIFHISIYEA